MFTEPNKEKQELAWENAKILRAMIEHENSLLSNRTNWVFAGQSFLILAVKLFWTESLLFVMLISVFGIFSSLSFFYTIRCSEQAIETLIEKFDEFNQNINTNTDPLYLNYYPPVIAYRLEEKLPIPGNKNLLIWNVLPVLLTIFWFIVLIGSIYSYYLKFLEKNL